MLHMDSPSSKRGAHMKATNKTPDNQLMNTRFEPESTFNSVNHKRNQKLESSIYLLQSSMHLLRWPADSIVSKSGCSPRCFRSYMRSKAQLFSFVQESNTSRHDHKWKQTVTLTVQKLHSARIITRPHFLRTTFRPSLHPSCSPACIQKYHRLLNSYLVCW